MNVKLKVTDNLRIIKLVLSGTGVRGAQGPTGVGADAANVLVAATPVNYTPATPDLEAHLAAIDAALGLLA
jgi:hypothetical protein